MKDATDDLKTIDQWASAYPGTNWGLACGEASGVIVIDVDPRHGGYESLKQLPIPPGTPSVLTGGGGQHFYFAYAPGLRNSVGNDRRSLPGIDVRSDGGYVVLPGGSHLSGGTYEWSENQDEALPAMPGPVLDALLARSTESGKGSQLSDSASILEGVPEGQRDDTLFRWACRLRRQHAGDEDGGRAVITQLVLAAARASNFPEDDALVKVEQAFKQNHDDDGARSRVDRLVVGGDFVLDEPEEIPAIWGSGESVLWAEGEGLMIAGHQGLGKTTIAQQLVLARMGLREGSLFGYSVSPARGRILYLAMDRPRQAARSFRRMVSSADRDLLNERLVVWRGPLPIDPTKRDALLEWVREVCEDADTVVVDSVKDLAPGLVDDSVASSLNSAWQSLIAEGIELLLLHHERKAGQDSKRKPTLDNIYGSTWLTSGLGSVLALSGQPGSDEVTAFHVKQPAETVGPIDIRHDHHAGVSSAVNVERLTVPQLLAMGGAYTVQELASLAGKSAASVRRELQSMGAIETPGANTSEGREPSRWRSPVASPVSRTWG